MIDDASVLDLKWTNVESMVVDVESEGQEAIKQEEFYFVESVLMKS